MIFHRQKGFSLIELSVVIAVIGLILAGIVASIEGIRRAEVRNVLTQLNELMVATEQFEELYHYLPGDIPNANSYWGTNCDITPANCNGNGNWLVDFNAADTEDHRVFQHLQLAGLYDKNTSYSTNLTPGSSIPEVAISNASFWFGNYNGLHAANHGNAYVLGKDDGATSPTGAVVTPTTAYDMDGKIDDQNASTGYVRAIRGSDFVTGCVDGEWNAAGVAYVLTDETQSCRMAFFYNFRP